MIRFQVNGIAREAEASLSLLDLLEELELGLKRLAVEINEEVVAKAAYEHTEIHDGDRIEIVSFVGGG